jgi:hypothetical protein
VTEHVENFLLPDINLFKAGRDENWRGNAEVFLECVYDSRRRSANKATKILNTSGD